MFFALSVRELPSAKATSTALGDLIVPQPLTYSTLFFLKRPSMPLVNPETVSSLAFCIADQSYARPVNVTPIAPMWSRASANAWLELSSALEGMQPTLRHVPPSEPRPSTHATFMPSCAALIAAT